MNFPKIKLSIYLCESDDLVKWWSKLWGNPKGRHCLFDTHQARMTPEVRGRIDLMLQLKVRQTPDMNLHHAWQFVDSYQGLVSAVVVHVQDLGRDKLSHGYFIYWCMKSVRANGSSQTVSNKSLVSRLKFYTCFYLWKSYVSLGKRNNCKIYYITAFWNSSGKNCVLVSKFPNT